MRRPIRTRGRSDLMADNVRKSVSQIFCGTDFDFFCGILYLAFECSSWNFMRQFLLDIDTIIILAFY